MGNKLILDIRTKEEYNQGHLKDAILVPTPKPPLKRDDVNTLQTRLIQTLKNQRVFGKFDYPIEVYCQKGIRSYMATYILRRLGYKNVTNLGGIS